MDEKIAPPPEGGAGKTGGREERLGAKLRENLSKRKEQARLKRRDDDTVQRRDDAPVEG
ncbi:hypothetical protein JZU48_00125 [bacterium]|nr:hypothetical protein [bacterium]